MGTRITTKREFQRARDGKWLGRDLHGIGFPRNATIPVAELVEADHYPDGYAKDGIPVALMPTGKFALYDSGASDGSENLYGFTLDPEVIEAGDVEIVVSVYFHGGIVLAHTLDGAAGAVTAADLPAGLWEA